MEIGNIYKQSTAILFFCMKLKLAAGSALTRKEVTLGESMGGFKSFKLSGYW